MKTASTTIILLAITATTYVNLPRDNGPRPVYYTFSDGVTAIVDQSELEDVWGNPRPILTTYKQYLANKGQ